MTQFQSQAQSCNMGNKTSKSSKSKKSCTHLFLYGNKASKNRNCAAQYQKLQKEIGNIEDLYLTGKMGCIMKSVDADTNKVMYWEHQDTHSAGWAKVDVNDHGILTVCCSVDSSQRFWITNKNQVFTISTFDKCIHFIIDYRLRRESVIDIITTHGRAFAICGCPSLSHMIHQITLICSFWMNKHDKVIPHDLIMIIYGYIGKCQKIYSTGTYPNGHPTADWDGKILRWSEVTAFKDVTIVSISSSFGCTLFLDNDGNVYQCHGERKYFGAPVNDYRYRSTAPYLVEYFVENKIKIIKIISDGGKSKWDKNLALDENGQIWYWKKPRKNITRWREPKPKLLEMLSMYRIIDIKACENVYYAKTKDDKHFLFGRIFYGQSELKKRNSEDYNTGNKGYTGPTRIDDIFYKKTKCKIKDVYLGYHNVFIVGVKDEKR